VTRRSLGGAALACLALGALPASGAGGVSVPVVRCHTSFGIAMHLKPAPASVRVAEPASSLAPLEAYSNGYLTALAPRGWRCAAQIGADGSGSLFVTAAPAGAHLAAPAVTVEFADTPGVAASLACPLFAAARAQLPVAPCPFRRPARELVTVLSRTRVRFHDPAGVHGDGLPSGGVDPADGVMAFAVSTSTSTGYALTETCTLPADRGAQCGSILAATFAAG